MEKVHVLKSSFGVFLNNLSNLIPEETNARNRWVYLFNEVEEVSKELLDTLKAERLVLDWRKRQRTHAAVQLAIEKILDHLPSIYSTDINNLKCTQVYHHVYEGKAPLK